MSISRLGRGWLMSLAIVGTTLPCAGHAAAGHLEDAIADVLVWVVLVMVPILAIWIFWKLHVLPEVIAEKKHHPQAEAIKSLCLLSLAFGGMLWPFAWLWAHTKPIGYQLAYGRDKHDHYPWEREPERPPGYVLPEAPAPAADPAPDIPPHPSRTDG